MMFLDTSALYAHLDKDDRFHIKAQNFFKVLIADNTEMVTSNYTITETISLTQARIGISAVKNFQEKMLPMIKIIWINEEIHNSAMDLLLDTNRKKLSFVDHTSLILMKNLEIKQVFTFDRHFSKQGFKVVP